jgi:hypothetical protein
MISSAAVALYVSTTKKLRIPSVVAFTLYVIFNSEFNNQHL